MTVVALNRDARQAQVQQWAVNAFGELATTVPERGRRFLEEALELFQSVEGSDAAMAHTLVDYVFGRPVGEPFQEVGGVMVTLMSLAECIGVSVEVAEKTETHRVLSTDVAHFQRRQAEKRAAGL